MPPRLRARFLVVSLFVAGCGSSVGSSPDAAFEPPVSITVLPADQELVIDGLDPATSTYQAIGTYADGRTEDITDRVGFALANPELGGFVGPDFKSGLEHGGRTRVLAQYAGAQGDTGLAIRIKQRYADPAATSLPADPAAPFAGPVDVARAPDIVYPNDGVLLPPNLGRLEVHLIPGPSNTLFEIAFSNALTDIKVYTRCVAPLDGGCIYTPDAKVWTWIAQTNRGGDDVTVIARATDDAGTGVGTSTSIAIGFSYDSVKGGIYYWKASGGATSESAIMRFDFGSVTQETAERFVGPDQAGGKCVGCHALSRDGTKMVAAAGGWDVKDSLFVDVGSATRTATPAKAAFMSWNPDATAYVGVFAYAGTPTHDLMLFDGTTGAQTGTIAVGATAAESTSHPDWSPDGTRIVYVRAGEASEEGVNNQRFYGGSIHMVEQQGSSFGAPTALVPAEAGRNRYYPSFSPDGALLAFNESTCTTAPPDRACNADSDPTATIFVVKPAPAASPVALARANAPGKRDTTIALTNSWPKWAPFEFQRTQTPGSRLVWMTFSSTRNFGLRKPPDGTSPESVSGSLLWMVAIDPDRALAGQDPSAAAFALPFQDLESSNHIAQWTQEVILLQ
jgi:hypothetical protein